MKPSTNGGALALLLLFLSRSSRHAVRAFTATATTSYRLLPSASSTCSSKSFHRTLVVSSSSVQEDLDHALDSILGEASAASAARKVTITKRTDVASLEPGAATNGGAVVRIAVAAHVVCVSISFPHFVNLYSLH